jgi:glycosyltransferase involved in cell wall biosynthesis
MTRRPRALVLSALSLGTGSGLRARYLCDALRRLGWDATLCAPAGPPKPYSSEMLLGAPRQWAAVLRAGRVDLAVGVKPYPNVWKALGWLRWRGAVTVCDVDDDDGGYRGGPLSLLTRVIQAPAFSAAEYLSTHHPLLKRRLAARVGGPRVLDLPQGVDLTVFDAARRRKGAAAWRRRRGLRGPLLAFTAHLNVACQLDVLLRCLGPWLRSHPAATLLVAGDGPDRARFEALAAPYGAQVRFLGVVTPEGAAQVLAAATLSVSAYGDNPGNRHRVPMKVAESLAMGLPVVSNLVPGLKPLKPYLFACAPQPAAFGRAVDQALRHGRARARLGQAFVRTQLGWDRAAAGLLKQLRRCGAALPQGSRG